MTVTLRDLVWPDLDAVVSLERALFPDDAWPATTWWAELAERPRRSYVVATVPDSATDGESIIGYAGLDLAGDTGDVMTVAVDPAYRGLGVGDALVTDLVSRARTAGVGALLLEVRADNAPALGLYERHGFVRLSLRRRYYQPGDVDAVVMRRLL